MQVVNNIIPERFGALVGAATAAPKLQQAMIDVLRRTKPANEVQARAIVDQVRTVGTETRVTEDLFGQQQVTESLYLERAQVLDASLRESRKDKTVFGRLLSEEERITEGGENILDRAANFERLQDAKDAQAKISRLANTKGPISDALTEAARAVKGGKKAREVTETFLESVRRTLLEGDSSGRQAGRARPGGDKAGAAGRVETPRDPEGAPTNPVDPAASATVKAETLHVLGKENDDLVRPVLAAIDKEFGTISNTSFKKIETIISKALRPTVLGKRPWFGIEHIRDGYRFKTVIAGGATFANIGHALDRLLTAIPGAQIIKSDPSMLFEPKDWGWRAAVFDLQMPNGQLVEWYMPIAELEGAKKAGGHQLFERWRDSDLPNLRGAEAKAFHADKAASRKLYNDAWAKVLLRMGQDESAARASMDKALTSSSGKILKDSAKSAPVIGVLPDLDQTSFSRTAIKPSSPERKTVPDSSSSEAKSGTLTSDAEIIPQTGGARIGVGGQVWHGSSFKFDAFSAKGTDSGLGSNTYGWGLYFSDSKKVAQGHQKPSGGLYKVNLKPKPTEYMVLYEPLAKQSEIVQKAVRGLIDDGSIKPPAHLKEDMYTEDVMMLAQQASASDKAASLKLLERGIRGVKYLTKKKDGFNYVIFDEADINILDSPTQSIAAGIGTEKLITDTAPRSIVRALDDSATPSPDPTRTGTVPDTEYDAALAQAQDIIDDQGALATVSREVNGELETRTLRDEIQDLDVLEDTIEDIRICSAARKAA